MAEIVASNANLARRYDLSASMRGVGPTLAFTLIALLPELGPDEPQTDRRPCRPWSDAEFEAATLHLRRAKGGTTATHRLLGDELRALRALKREAKSPFIFVSERGARSRLLALPS